MKVKKTVTSLPVVDLERSLKFYRDGLGLETPGIDDNIIAIEIPGLSLFLIEWNYFEEFTAKANLLAHAGEDNVECIFSCALENKEEIDETLQKVVEFGGTVAHPAKDEEWGYTGYFRDPDGHLWEIVYPHS